MSYRQRLRKLETIADPDEFVVVITNSGESTDDAWIRTQGDKPQPVKGLVVFVSKP